MRWCALLPLFLLPTGGAAHAAAADSVVLRPILWVNANSDLGLLAGGGVRWSVFPKGDTTARHQMQLRAGLASTPRAGAIEFTGLVRPRAMPGMALVAEATHSAIEVLNFFGFGTDTRRDPTREDAYYKAGQTHTVVAVGPMVRLGAGASLTVTAVLKQVHTEPDSTRFIFLVPRYGVQPHFDQAGVRGMVVVDRRDHPLLPRRGVRLDLGMSYYPGVLDARSPFGRLSASVAGAVTPTFLPTITLAGRVAGVRTLGTYPLHEAAILGGSTTLRSHKNGRFAGDASLLASLDARARLGRVTLRDASWEVGVYTLGDVGRVFHEPERSSRWHHSVGGGVWLSHPDRRVIGRVELATGDDGIGFRLGTGFRF